jgi:hypothetical protein
MRNTGTYVPSHFTILASEYVVNFAFWAIIAVFIVTSLIWPWWKSFWGVNIVSLELAIDLALVPSVLSLDFGFSRLTSWPGAWVQIGAVFLAACIVVWRGFLIIHDQLRGAQVAPVQLWWALLRSAGRRLRH